MSRQHSSAYQVRDQRFNDKFPGSIVAVLAIVQMLTTFAVFAFEVGHDIVNLQLTNLFAGFWTAIPFTITWISMFSVVCCCRRRSCATHAAMQNFVSLVFAGILIGINIAFLQRPNKCFFNQKICESLSWVNPISEPFKCYFDSNTDSGCGNTRLALIKAQLAAAIIMAVACLLYLVIYLGVISAARRRPTPTAAQAVMAPVHPYPMPYQQHPYTIANHSHQPSAPAMIPAYAPSAPVQMVAEPGNVNNGAANQYALIYPKLSNDRF